MGNRAFLSILLFDHRLHPSLPSSSPFCHRRPTFLWLSSMWSSSSVTFCIITSWSSFVIFVFFLCSCGLLIIYLSHDDHLFACSIKVHSFPFLSSSRSHFFSQKPVASCTKPKYDSTFTIIPPVVYGRMRRIFEQYSSILNQDLKLIWIDFRGFQAAFRVTWGHWGNIYSPNSATRRQKNYVGKEGMDWEFINRNVLRTLLLNPPVLSFTSLNKPLFSRMTIISSPLDPSLHLYIEKGEWEISANPIFQSHDDWVWASIRDLWTFNPGSDIKKVTSITSVFTSIHFRD